MRELCAAVLMLGLSIAFGQGYPSEPVLEATGGRVVTMSAGGRPYFARRDFSPTSASRIAVSAAATLSSRLNPK